MSQHFHSHYASKEVTAQEVIDFIGNREVLSIKDSYSNLDLFPFGYKILFEAEWIYHEPISNLKLIDLRWRKIKTENELINWTSVCNLEGIIKTDILVRPDVEIFIHKDTGTKSGFIANVSGDVIGISNVFSESPFQNKLWSDIPQIVSSRFPGLPLVGYEHGDALKAALHLGWKSLGPLRVWIKDN